MKITSSNFRDLLKIILKFIIEIDRIFLSLNIMFPY